MRIRQHNYDFIAGIDPTETEFTTLIGLLSIPFVAHSRRDSDFSHFAVSECGISRTHRPRQHAWRLVGVYDGGKKWRVVGYLDELPPELSCKLSEEMRWSLGLSAAFHQPTSDSVARALPRTSDGVAPYWRRKARLK